jgi:hypothetical protein
LLEAKASGTLRLSTDFLGFKEYFLSTKKKSTLDVTQVAANPTSRASNAI